MFMLVLLSLLVSDFVLYYFVFGVFKKIGLGLIGFPRFPTLPFNCIPRSLTTLPNTYYLQYTVIQCMQLHLRVMITLTAMFTLPNPSQECLCKQMLITRANRVGRRG